MDNSLRAQLLDNVAISPATTLAPKFGQEIREYLHRKDFREIVSFIRTLRDKMIQAGGCSDYVLSVIELLIRDEPDESPEQLLFRRQVAGLAGFDDDEPMDPDLEITKVDVPRSNPSNSWPPPGPVPVQRDRRTL